MPIRHRLPGVWIRDNTATALEKQFERTRNPLELQLAARFRESAAMTLEELARSVKKTKPKTAAILLHVAQRHSDQAGEGKRKLEGERATSHQETNVYKE